MSNPVEGVSSTDDAMSNMFSYSGTLELAVLKNAHQTQRGALHLSASERTWDNLNYCKEFYLKAKARIWP